MTMYQLTNSTSIKRLADNASIPADGGNRDYREYLEWLDAGNTPLPADEPPAPNPLALAEAHIASHFSTARLLQMKDWRDTFPEEDAPMLEAVYDWLNGITIAAAQGQTTFAAPPHTFEELVAEAMFILGVEQP
jgi:hypothetical protein